MASDYGRQADDRVVCKSGQPDHERRQTGNGARRLGARLLPQISESPPRIYRSLVEHRELGRNHEELRSRKEVSSEESMFVCKKPPRRKTSGRFCFWRDQCAQILAGSVSYG